MANAHCSFICRPESLRSEKDPRSKPGCETWSYHVSGAMFGGLFRLCLLAIGLSVQGFCFLRSTTFAIARRAVPDGENHVLG